METVKVLGNLTITDLESILAPGIAPGVSSNWENAKEELLKISKDMPVLKEVIPMANEAVRMGDINAIVYFKTVVNLLILLYKKDKQSKIDEILKR